MPYIGFSNVSQQQYQVFQNPDINGTKLKLDADGDTSITSDTDDQIDVEISGADDFQFTANTFTVLSGSTLTIASGATIANSGTATGFSSADPASADGDTLGTASAEWSDLYLADSSVIYFGADQDITLTHSPDAGLTTNGTFQATTITATTAVVPDASDGAALGTAALEWSDLFLADGAVINFGDDQDVTLTHSADTSLTCNLMIAATTFEPTGDTAAGDNSALGYTSVLGAILTGQGSTNDVTLVNDADATVLGIATGTTNVDIVGDLTAGTLNADGDTAAGDDAAIGWTSAEGIIITGQGSTNDVTIKNDADADVITIPTGATGVVLAGALTLGDGLEIDVASGDPKIVFDTQGADKFVLGVDDSDSDKFKIDTGGTVGGATVMEISNSDKSVFTQHAIVKINAQTGTTYTTVLTDSNKLITLSNGSSITLTIPPNSSVAYPIGTVIACMNLGAGIVTTAQGSGVTIRSRNGLVAGGQYAVWSLTKFLSDTWILAGDVTS
jgi:hypothetical protein